MNSDFIQVEKPEQEVYNDYIPISDSVLQINNDGKLTYVGRIKYDNFIKETQNKMQFTVNIMCCTGVYPNGYDLASVLEDFNTYLGCLKTIKNKFT